MSPSLVPAGARAERVRTPRGEVRVLRSTSTPSEPEAPPLLLVHGGGTDNAGISWFHAFETVGPQRRVLALDLPGFGETTVAAVGGGAAMADVVVEVADALGLTRVVVVGVSMGGEVAMELALRDPGRVAGLVLIAPGGLVPLFRNHPTQLAAWLAAQLPDVVLLPLARAANRFVEQALRAMVVDVAALPTAVADEFVREARRPGAAMGYARYNQASLGPLRMRNDLTPRVDAIDVPVLFFHGAQDPLVPLAGSARAADLMPDAELVVAAGAGHWAQLEAPELFVAALCRFLARPTL